MGWGFFVSSPVRRIEGSQSRGAKMVAGLDIAYPLYRYAGLARERTHGRTDLCSPKYDGGGYSPTGVTQFSVIHIYDPIWQKIFSEQCTLLTAQSVIEM